MLLLLLLLLLLLMLLLLLVVVLFTHSVRLLLAVDGGMVWWCVCGFPMEIDRCELEMAGYD